MTITPPSDTSDETTVQDWAVSRVGMSVEPPGISPPRCDYCGGVVLSESVAHHYASDTDYLDSSTQNDALRLQRLYCHECHRNSILEPCAGVREVLIEHELTRDYRITSPRVIATSGRTHGLNWDPVEVADSILHTPLEQLAGGANSEVAPESVSDALAMYGIQVVDVVDKTGDLVPDVTRRGYTDHMEMVHSTLRTHDSLSPVEWLRKQDYPPTGMLKLD